ncbi:3-hydroxyacyl-CoA dehydrogenase [Cumulibacter manganitolerans]|uniref:3-hydroxyacyl-CoA dehydrogenase n=1 Tax=Cumulibacter manganitolerans TaxID=1884992 RepID=UPI001295069C|nr:3-hydroxyacyl-CoA dehydrogenase [Cumulibacter manganitolerans]
MSQQSAADYLREAEQTAVRVDDIPADTPVRNVGKVGVIGAGTMGGGIAMVFSNAGHDVVLVEQAQEGLDRGLATIKGNYDRTAAKGKISEQDVAERMGRITPSLSLDDLADVDLVIEAVFEDLEVKKDLFARLDKIVKQGAILGTNTSRLDIDQIAAATERPQDVIGLHFFSPANVMRLLEVVRGEKTAPDVIATCMQLAPTVGKKPVLARICDGFIGNRMLTPYRREAEFVLEEGATPERVDGVLKNFGMAMGPFAMGDLAGLDVSWAGRKRQAATRDKSLRYSTVADRICEAGRFGQKTGAGWYRYEKGDRTPIPDPEIDALIEKSAQEAGIERGEVSDQEIIDRTILALVNEGAQLLDEGIAQRASDIDVVYVNGYGFPADRGGPMHWAEQRGLGEVLAKIEEYHRIHGAYWKPAELLRRRVADGADRF